MSAPLLKIREELAAKIRAHGVETYPHECCGAILGRDEDGDRAKCLLSCPWPIAATIRRAIASR